MCYTSQAHDKRAYAWPGAEWAGGEGGLWPMQDALLQEGHALGKAVQADPSLKAPGFKV